MAGFGAEPGREELRTGSVEAGGRGANGAGGGCGSGVGAAGGGGAARGSEPASIGTARLGVRKFAGARCEAVAERGGCKLRRSRCGRRRWTRPAAWFRWGRLRWRRTDRSLCRRRGIRRCGLFCWTRKAGRCARSRDGSGCGAASSGFAWVAIRGQSAHRRIRVPEVLLRTTTPVALMGRAQAGSAAAGGH